MDSTYVAKLYKLATSLNYNKVSVHNILDVRSEYPNYTQEEMISQLRKRKYWSVLYSAPPLVFGGAASILTLSMMVAFSELVIPSALLFPVALGITASTFFCARNSIVEFHSYNDSIKLVRVLSDYTE